MAANYIELILRFDFPGFEMPLVNADWIYISSIPTGLWIYLGDIKIFSEMKLGNAGNQTEGIWIWMLLSLTIHRKSISQITNKGVIIGNYRINFN